MALKMTNAVKNDQKRQKNSPGATKEKMLRSAKTMMILFVLVAIVISLLVLLKIYVPGRAWLN